MHSRVCKWGDSQGLRLPRTLLREARIEVGDQVEVIVRDGEIVVAASHPVRGRYRLEDLLASIPEGGSLGEIDWGAPVSREVW